MKTINGIGQRLKSFWEGNRLTISLLLLIFIVFVIIIPDTTTPGKYDRRCWITWANYMLGNGLGNVYKLDVNYLPLYHYVLFVYAKIQGSTEGIIFNVNSLKSFTLFFELVGVFFAIFLTRKKYISEFTCLILSMLIVFNPAFFYDSILYGQVDGIYSTFIFVSIFFGIKEKPTFSLLAFIIALNLKLQAVTFLPLVFLVNLGSMLKYSSFVKVIKVLIPSLLLQIVILLPFISNGDLGLVWNVVKGSEGKYPFVSMGAFNFWYYFVEDPKYVSDAVGFWGRSYKRYGQLLYLVMIFIALFPYIKWNIDVYIKRKKLSTFSVEKILIIGILMSVIFFYFNTEMHARYIHASMIFAGAYFLYSRKYLIFSVLSVAYFLNIESSAKILKGNIVEYTYFFFNPIFISFLFAIVLVLCFQRLYSKDTNSEDISMHSLYAQ